MRSKTGQNSTDSKYYNRGLILQLIATGQCRTRIELARATGLTKMTVTNIVAEFMEKQILTECEEELTEVCGRNPILLQISEEAPKVIGLLIFRDRMEAVLCDFTMQILQRERIDFTKLTEQQLVENAFCLVDAMLSREKHVAGIGVAVIGPVDINTGTLLNPVRFYGIHDLPILSILKEKYQIPVYLDHDNNSAALAEKLYGVGKHTQDFLFLGISNGIGSGIISNGEVYHSRRGLESEVGHVSIDYRGPLCSCGNRGCLEMYASVFTTLKQLREKTGKMESYAYFCHQKDRVVEEIFEDTIEKISAALVSSIHILQPELIVLGHECMEWDDRYVKMLEDRINEKKMAKDSQMIPVKKAYFGKDAQLTGAASNVMIQIFKGNLRL